MCDLTDRKCDICPKPAEWDSIEFGMLCQECLDKSRDEVRKAKEIIAQNESTEQSTNDVDRVVSMVEKQIILCRVAAPLFGNIVGDLYRQEAAKSASADLKGERPAIEINVLEAINFSLSAAAQLMTVAGIPLKLVFDEKEKDKEDADKENETTD